MKNRIHIERYRTDVLRDLRKNKTRKVCLMKPRPCEASSNKQGFYFSADPSPKKISVGTVLGGAERPPKPSNCASPVSFSHHVPKFRGVILVVQTADTVLCAISAVSGLTQVDDFWGRGAPPKIVQSPGFSWSVRKSCYFWTGFTPISYEAALVGAHGCAPLLA